METILKLAILGCLGLGIEVVFTSIGSALNSKKQDRVHLKGHASLWYLPLYGAFIPLAFYLLQDTALSDTSWPIRIPVYALLLQLGEFICMWLLHLLNGKSPSEDSYNSSSRSIAGFTRWDYYPAFILLALLFEYTYGILFVS